MTTLDVSPGTVATIQVFGRGMRQATGISARFEYDSAQVAYEGFDAGGLSFAQCTGATSAFE